MSDNIIIYDAHQPKFSVNQKSGEEISVPLYNIQTILDM
jgi:hypothetical protein